MVVGGGRDGIYKTACTSKRCGGLMKTIYIVGTARDVVTTLGLVVGAGTLFVAAYLFLRFLPDLRRYIRISTM
jgi:hypothetical protein